MKAANSLSAYSWRFLGSLIVGLILPVFIVIVVCFCRLTAGWSNGSWTDEGIQGFSVFIGFIGFLFFSLNYWSDECHIFVTKLRAGTVIYSKITQKVEEVLDKVTYLRDTHPVLGESYLVTRIAESGSLRIVAHPVTSNPKVRDIICQLQLKVMEETVAGFQRVIHFAGEDKFGRAYLSQPSYCESGLGWGDAVKSLLYDFIEVHSRDLAELYNPLNKEHQERFARLVHGFFDQRLAESGLTIESCTFSL